MYEPLNAPWSPTAQTRIYRGLLAAQAEPGLIIDLSPWLADQPAWLGVLATLADRATTLADPGQLLDRRDLGLLGAVLAPAGTAMFILADGHNHPDFTPSPGDLDHPERGATVVVAVSGLGRPGRPVGLQGPGVRPSTTLMVDGLDPAWWSARAAWCAGYPCGVDLILTAGSQLAALPRTTRVEEN